MGSVLQRPATRARCPRASASGERPIRAHNHDRRKPCSFSAAIAALKLRTAFLLPSFSACAMKAGYIVVIS